MSKKMFFEKNFFFFYAFLGSKRIEQMRRWAVQKAQDTALKAADSKKGRTLSKARGIGAEMSCRRRSCRRRDGAGQSGSFASVKAREAANCSGKPGARRLRRARARKKTEAAFTFSLVKIRSLFRDNFRFSSKRTRNRLECRSKYPTDLRLPTTSSAVRAF